MSSLSLLTRNLAVPFKITSKVSAPSVKMDILKSLAHPEEVKALLQFKFRGRDAKCNIDKMSDSSKACYDMLNKTSRSFAAVIQALDGDLRNAVCIFYLVLRALDTVEDDMSIPKGIKIQMLRSFHNNLQDPDWKYTESQDKDRIVLEKFPLISQEFRALAPVYRDLISDICARMGEGMTVYLEKEVDTMAEWDEYCHYVAGLVGIGLAGLFSASDLEDSLVGEDKQLANKVGLFLQKTNIIRDYLEDVTDERIFWPKSTWTKYASEIGDFAKPEHGEKALNCLNDLITNAMELVPDSLEFMSRLHNQSVFNFVAIPQVMAIATLERCYNNPKVFSGVVKIRKGEAVRMMIGATSYEKVKAMMRHFTLEIMERIPDSDPSAAKTRLVCQKALDASQTSQEFSTPSLYPPIYVSVAMMAVTIGYNYWSQISSFYNELL